MERDKNKIRVCGILCVFFVLLYSPVVMAGEKAKKDTSKKDDFINNLVEEMPYGETLKDTWEFMDGKTDVMGVENLRVDFSNRGVTYKTSYMPFVGELEGGQFEAELGEDNKLTFESNYVPVLGWSAEGLKFKTSVGNDDSSVSIRYKIALP